MSFRNLKKIYALPWETELRKRAPSYIDPAYIVAITEGEGLHGDEGSMLLLAGPQGGIVGAVNVNTLTPFEVYEQLKASVAVV
jgi:hypothetical protein